MSFGQRDSRSAPTEAEEADGTRHARHVELAQQVLEAAMESGWGTGDRMSEQVLAGRCNVSRTPIRKALQLLAQRGVVVADTGGGYRLAVDPSEVLLRSSSLPTSEDEDLAKSIVRDLAAGRIPVSQTVIGLQRRYGASRLAVQNALTRLSECQIVERAAGQQWLLKASVVGEEALIHSDDFRLLLLPSAVLAPGFRLDTAGVNPVRQGLESLVHQQDRDFDGASFERMDVEFSRLIARSCGNPFLTDALLSHIARRAFIPIPLTSVFKMRESAKDKLRILAQLEREQLELAADLLRVHLRMSSAQRPKMLGRGVPPVLRAGFGLQ